VAVKVRIIREHIDKVTKIITSEYITQNCELSREIIRASKEVKKKLKNGNIVKKTVDESK